MSYFATYTGRKIDFENFKESDVCLEDISHHLSNIQRFGGAVDFKYRYSVAEHCMNVMSAGEHLSKEAARYALMHDAAEAYIGDVVTSFKALLPDYKEIEKHVEDVIFSKYNIDTSHRAQVKEIDSRIMLNEVLAFMPEKYSLYKAQLPDIEPLHMRLEASCVPPQHAKKWFLMHCTWCGIGD